MERGSECQKNYTTHFVEIKLTSCVLMASLERKIVFKTQSP